MLVCAALILISVHSLNLMVKQEMIIFLSIHRKNGWMEIIKYSKELFF